MLAGTPPFTPTAARGWLIALPMLVAGCGGVDPGPGAERGADSGRRPEPPGVDAGRPAADAVDAAVAAGTGAAESRPAAPRPSEPDSAVTAPAEEGAPAGWVLYRHPRGTSMHHPPGWRVEEAPGGLVVIPPDHDGAREVIRGTAGPADGLTDPMGLRARRRIDRSVAELMPGLKRVGRGRRVDTRDGTGAAYDYRGRLPDGTEVRARVLATIADDALGGLSVLADAERFEARADVVEAMFKTIHRAEAADGSGGEGTDAAGEPAALPGNLDPRLVGAFRGESIASGGGAYVNTRLVYALGADGTLLFGARSHMSASRRGADGNLRWTADGASGDSVRSGRWTAAGGVLTIRWDGGGRSRFAYGFEPDGTLALRDPNTRELIDIYSRVR